MGFKAKFTFGLIGAICDGIKDSKTSGSSRSNPIKIDLPTTPTTVPTGIGLGKGGVLDTLEKLDTILMDVDTEGEKRGYERAAAEYDVAYERIENEYLETKKMFESQKANKDEESSRLIKKLQRLEEEKKILERELREKTKQVSNKYDIPVSTVSKSLAAGTLLTSQSGMGIFDLIYQYKNKKLKEAEEKGYNEARRLYKKKISELKNNLECLREKGDAELQELTKLIIDIIKEISNLETKNAELEIALNN